MLVSAEDLNRWGSSRRCASSVTILYGPNDTQIRVRPLSEGFALAFCIVSLHPTLTYLGPERCTAEEVALIFNNLYKGY